MLINLSNHPLATWIKEQREEAEKQFGRIVDLPFPAIAPESELEQIIRIAAEYIDRCFAEFAKENPVSYPNAIHVMGEMSFVYQFVKMMSEQGVLCVASTTRRIILDEKNQKKTSQFEFVRFRPFTEELF